MSRPKGGTAVEWGRTVIPRPAGRQSPLRPCGELSIYTINRIKRDFDIDDINGADDIVEISIEGGKHGEN